MNKDFTATQLNNEDMLIDARFYSATLLTRGALKL